ncbi:class I SAM-dependent methyltransferase, partial [Verrucomicrobiales bacterium]|nr:class I SAM-dependent methyltransferase [Verrucomicrobiales bacterium]
INNLIRMNHFDSAVERFPVFKELLEEGAVCHPDGSKSEVVANISLDCCRALHEFVVSEKPQIVAEIGMAYGMSTLSILTTLEANECGRLISIDPYPG